MPPALAGPVLRTAIRFARVVAHFVWGWMQLTFVFPWIAEPRRAARVKSWCVKMLALARIRVRTEGGRAPGPVMVVSNHISWLDMVAIQSACPCRFVAKSEVRRWPLIGAMATRLGTIYLERSRTRSAAAVTQQVAELLRSGHTIAVFPEGTSTDGTAVRPFQAALLQAPIDARALVQPIALTYLEADGRTPCRRAAYCDDDSLLRTMWRTLSGDVTLHLAMGPPFAAGGLPRRALAVLLHSQVQALRSS